MTVRWFSLSALLLLVACAGARDLEKAAPPAPEAPPWAMQGGGPARRSYVHTLFHVPFHPQSITPLIPQPGYKPMEAASPLLIDGTVYVGHSGGSFDAVDLSTGTIKWRLPTEGHVYSSAAFGKGLLVFGDDGGNIRAVSLDGVERWSFKVQYPVLTGPLIDGPRVYVAVADQNIFCLELTTGRPLWQYGKGFPRRNSVWPTTGICAAEGRIYATFSDGAVVALDAEVGAVLWRATVGRGALLGDVTAGPTYAEGHLYVGSFQGPAVSLDGETGEQEWESDADAAAGFAVGEEAIYLANARGGLTALDRESGEILWNMELGEGAASAPVLGLNILLTGASGGSLFAVDPLNGKKLDQYSPGPGVRGQPLLTREGIVFLSNGGALHWLR